MDKTILNKLKKIVGPKNVLTEYEERICYSYDGSFLRGIPRLLPVGISKPVNS
ncbi:MAG: hypothetical protein ACOWWO_14410 [Peptococcaceae bacterium]